MTIGDIGIREIRKLGITVGRYDLAGFDGGGEPVRADLSIDGR